MTVAIDDVGRVCLPGNPTKEQARAFLAEFEKTPEGREVGLHLDGNYMALINSPTLQATFDRMNQEAGGKDISITLATFVAIVRTMLLVRDPSIFPQAPAAAPAAAAPAAPRARNADGTFISEFESWSNAPGRSVQEMRQRAAADRAYGEWFRAQYHSQTLTEGAYKVLGGPPERATTLADRSQLGAFARAYQDTSIERIRKPINGYVTLNNGERFTPADLRELVEECSRVGLL